MAGLTKAEGLQSRSVIGSTAILPSLGASGAVYAALVTTALAYPDTHISLILPPTPPIGIQYGVGGLVLMDVVGALRGWKMLDHWAHLGGAAFGAMYWRYGSDMWDRTRVLTR